MVIIIIIIIVIIIVVTAVNTVSSDRTVPTLSVKEVKNASQHPPNMGPGPGPGLSFTSHLQFD